jgi:alanine racemase
MLKPNHRAWVEIDLDAVQYNVRSLLKLLSPKTALMAIVKADAYGHGAVGVSQAALSAGATWLGVATIPEGIQLRNAGITAPILILAAINSREEGKAIAEFRLQPTLVNGEQALNFDRLANDLGVLLPVHLKVDTGMTRLGINWRDAIPFIELVQSLPYLEVRSVYSHLATADESDPSFMYEQHHRFESVRSQLQLSLRSDSRLPIRSPSLHLCNTAGMLSDRKLHYDMVRVGLGLHGFCPAPHLAPKIDLRPVMEVKAKIAQINQIEAGTGISYGHSFVSDRSMKIATVGIGYADGLPRLLSNQIQVLIGDRLVRQVGTITMDQCMVDVTELPSVGVGDTVTFLGKQAGIKATDWAERLGTIPWEILCGFKHRLPRLIVNSVGVNLE